MFKRNPINEAHERLAARQREYEEAHAHTVALERELIAAQIELSRLQPDEPGKEALPSLAILGVCGLCGRAVTFRKTGWVGNCRGCVTTLHPRRHGELTPGNWKLRVYSSMDEASYQDNWYWTVEYQALYEEHPPEGKIYLDLRGELGQSLRVEGSSWYVMDKDRHETYRIITWAGTVFEDVNAAQAWATRAFVKPRIY